MGGRRRKQRFPRVVLSNGFRLGSLTVCARQHTSKRIRDTRRGRSLATGSSLTDFCSTARVFASVASDILALVGPRSRYTQWLVAVARVLLRATTTRSPPLNSHVVGGPPETAERFVYN